MSSVASPIGRFSKIHKAAIKRKGGEAAVQSLFPKVLTARQLARLSDAKILAAMTKIINRVQFNWDVVEKKWPDFEEAFLGFDPEKLSGLSDEAWEQYLSDKRIVRSGAKIRATRENSVFVTKVAKSHGSFGAFLASWPPDDQVGLMAYLKTNGSRLGGQSSAWVLRMIGWDAFVLTPDVVKALQAAGCDIADNPSSKRDLERVQTVFNSWREESGLPYAHISRIAACSVGENLDTEYILDQAQRYFEQNIN